MVNQQAIYLSAWRVSHEHIDQDKPKENLLRRLLLSVEEGKQEQPTTIAMLQTRSILRQKASLYEKLQERRSRRFYLIQRGRSHVGMARDEQGLKKAIKEIRELREDFYKNVNVPGSQFEFNQELEKALRLEDFFEIGELMARDALNRQESCGGHFRVESQTEEGEAKRDDVNFMYVAAWEYKGEGVEPELHKEPLKYEFIEVKTRNYKD